MTRVRVHEIDLFRFLAALSVVFFHYTFRGHTADAMSSMPYSLLAPLTKYGYFGVDFFFMISGFVILMTASRGSLRGFAVSRLVRLYPAFWACCTLTFIATVAMGAPRFTASPGQYLVNLTMLSGFVKVPPIDGVYWSLFVELKFYALVALLLVFGKIHRIEPFLILWLVASFALEVFPVHLLRYVLVVDYSGYFIAGAMCFLIWAEGLTPVRVGVILAAWVLSLYEAANRMEVFEAHYHTPLSGYLVAFIVSSFFGIMLLVSLRRTGFVGRRPWLAAGALTYPLYLLHQDIGYMVFNHAYPRINAHLLLWGTILFMLAASYAVHVLVERRYAPPMKAALNKAFDAAERLLPQLIANKDG